MPRRSGQQQRRRRQHAQRRVDDERDNVRTAREVEHEARRHRADGLPQRRERFGNAPYGSQRLPTEEIGVGHRRHHQDSGHRHTEQTRSEIGQQHRIRHHKYPTGQSHHQRDDGVGV